MPKLPQWYWKLLTNHQDPVFIEQRREDLQKYMRAIIAMFPDLLQETFARDFLGIPDPLQGGKSPHGIPLLHLGEWRSLGTPRALAPAARFAHSCSLVATRCKMPAPQALDGQRENCYELEIFGGYANSGFPQYELLSDNSRFSCYYSRPIPSLLPFPSSSSTSAARHRGRTLSTPSVSNQMAAVPASPVHSTPFWIGSTAQVNESGFQLCNHRAVSIRNSFSLSADRPSYLTLVCGGISA